MFIANREFSLGNAKDDINKQREKNLEIRKKLCEANENKECNGCWVKPVCAKSYGHCIGARYLAGGDISKPEKNICDISKCVIENIFVQTYKKYGMN